MHEENEDQGNPFALLLRLLGAGVVAGVLVAFIALPGVGSAGLTARDAANNFQNMDAKLKTSPPPEKTVVYDSKGKQLAVFFDKYRESVRLDQVAPIMREAIIGIEDSRFYSHGALDMKGTLRALATNVEANETAQGGSTLTQQYVKNLLAEGARDEDEYKKVTAPTLGRKLRELRYALDVEEKMSKDQILEGYLNIAYFGGGAYGVQAAAKRYFSKPASKLGLGEAALLAGITKNPTSYDPTLHPKKARERRDIVLARMVQLGKATKAEAEAAAAKPVELNETKPRGGCEISKAPYFCEYVRYDLYNILSDGKYWGMNEKRRANIRHKLAQGGYTIRTTIDMQAQRALNRAVLNGGNITPSGHRVAAEAMVEPGTGMIRAMGASKKFGAGKGRTVINLAADGGHGGGTGVSAGSTFKTFTLATALDEGIPVRTSINSPAHTVVPGFQPCKYTGVFDGKRVKNADVGGGPFPVNNAGDSEAGNFNLKNGTWHSVNTFYAQLEKRVGVCDAVEMAKRFGMKRADGEALHPVPSQVLGTNEIDMVHLAAAYAGFAARGKYCAPLAVTEVSDRDGKKLKLPKPDCNQAVSEDVADEVNQILKGVLTQGTAKNIGGIGRPSAGKTGTCENFSCAVFAGHTPNMAAAVAYWDIRGGFGYPVEGVYGADIPAPIWAQSMRGALEGKPAPGFLTPRQDFGDVNPVPDVRGLSIGAANAELRTAGFKPQVSPHPVPSDRPKGTVAGTSPDAGSDADPGTTVIIYMSSGKDKRGGPGGGNPDGPGGFQWPWQ